MALTQAQIDAFLKLKGKLFGTGGELLIGEQDMLVALVTLSDQLAGLTTAITGREPDVTPAGGPLVNTELSLNLPLTLKEINQFILATQDAAGYVTSYMSQLASIVPAAGTGGPGTLTFTYAVPPGYVAASIAPWVITTDNVAANISASISVDGKNVINPLVGLVFGPGMEIPGVQYIVATSTGLQTVYVNNTASPVTVYVQAELMLIDKSFYNDFYAPLLNFGFQRIKSSLGLGG